MRHRKAGKKLSRTMAHRKALRRNLAAGLFLHGKIETTLAKAKDIRPFAERLITRAKGGTLHDRRVIAARLHNDEAEKKLFSEIADRFKTRQGGYTSIHRLASNRLRDDAPMAVIELVTWEPGEKMKSKKRRRAPKKFEKKPAETPVPAVSAPQTEAAGAAEQAQPSGEEKTA